MKVCIGLLSSILNGTSLDNFSGLFANFFPRKLMGEFEPRLLSHDFKAKLISQPRLCGVFSQAHGQQLCWMNRVWVMLLVAAALVLVTASRPPEYWLPIGAK